MFSVLTSRDGHQMLADVQTDERGGRWFRVMTASGFLGDDWQVEPVVAGVTEYRGPIGDDDDDPLHPRTWRVARVHRKSMTLEHVEQLSGRVTRLGEPTVNVRVLL